MKMTTRETHPLQVEEKSARFATLVKTKMKSYFAMDAIEVTTCTALILPWPVFHEPSGTV